MDELVAGMHSSIGRELQGERTGNERAEGELLFVWFRGGQLEAM